MRRAFPISDSALWMHRVPDQRPVRSPTTTSGCISRETASRTAGATPCASRDRGSGRVGPVVRCPTLRVSRSSAHPVSAPALTKPRALGILCLALHASPYAMNTGSGTAASDLYQRARCLLIARGSPAELPPLFEVELLDFDPCPPRCTVSSK